MALIDKVVYLDMLVKKTVIPIKFNRGPGTKDQTNEDCLHEIAANVPDLLEGIIFLRTALGHIADLNNKTDDPKDELLVTAIRTARNAISKT